MTRPPRAVLNSDVIYSRVLHELFGRLGAGARLIDLMWSEELLAEAHGALVGRKRVPAAADAWVGYLRRAFPGEGVDLSTLPPGIDVSELTNDRDDEHVCALAVAGQADCLLTFDRSYLGVEVSSPDVFLSAQIAEEPGAVLAELANQTRSWRGGEHSVGELIDAFELLK